MKRIVFAVTAILCGSTTLFGCDIAEKPDDPTLSIVCTIFPAYDWVREIVGDIPNISITLLCDKGSDLHSYQPTVSDMVQVQNADVLILVGAETDAWIAEDAGTETTTILLLDYAQTKEEVFTEGMQAKRHADDDEDSVDEHVWLSLRQAERICDGICDTLAEKDRYNADTYRENTRNYQAELAALDVQYSDTLCADSCILVADRFPFLYLADDYQLTYYAAFQGCNAEAEVSFSTLVTLSEKAKENDISTIFITETGDTKMADTIAETAGITPEIVTLYAMESITQKELDEGVTYLSRMTENLEILCRALN